VTGVGASPAPVRTSTSNPLERRGGQRGPGTARRPLHRGLGDRRRPRRGRAARLAGVPPATVDRPGRPGRDGRGGGAHRARPAVRASRCQLHPDRSRDRRGPAPAPSDAPGAGGHGRHGPRPGTSPTAGAQVHLQRGAGVGGRHRRGHRRRVDAARGSADRWQAGDRRARRRAGLRRHQLGGDGGPPAPDDRAGLLHLHPPPGADRARGGARDHLRSASSGRPCG
jgi:hypothetical protein